MFGLYYLWRKFFDTVYINGGIKRASEKWKKSLYIYPARLYIKEWRAKERKNKLVEDCKIW